jgi:hypothetical protein
MQKALQRRSLSVDTNEPIVLCTTTNPIEAEFLKNLLEAEGIKCELTGENQGSFTGLFDIRLLVRAWDEDRARQVLNAHDLQHKDHAWKYHRE